MSEKEKLAKEYNCKPEDIEIKVTYDKQGNKITEITVKAPVKIEGDFEI